MGVCGAPTLTCVLILLFMAALYAGVNSNTDDGISEYNMDASEVESLNGYKMSARIVRNIRAIGKGRSKDKKKRKDKDDIDIDLASDKRQNKRRGEKVNDKKKDKRKKPQLEGGRRSRPGNNKDGLPPGINRRMMRLAEKIHIASTPFAAQLFKAVTPQVTNNIVMSPLSVHTALTMTMLGAKGRTEKEMLIALGLRQAKLRNKKPHQAYKALLTSLQSVHPEVKVSGANAVFVKPNIPLEDAFRQGLTQNYNATLDSFQLDHPQGPESPINSWVANVTNQKIQNLLAPETITPMTALVLVNAIYFNASWSNPFDDYATKPGQFNTLAGGVKTVDMMSAEHDYGYANHHNTEVVELLYKGNRLAMYILLPNPTSNITQLHQTLLNSEQQGSNSFDRMFDNLNPTPLKLFLPKFKVESDALDLKQPLQKLGIVKAFDPQQADFTGISSGGNFHIDAVIHKAFIDVSESGTEAAAATAVILVPMSLFRGEEVKVDRPFMFVIRDRVLKEVLFIGAYVG